MRTIGTTEPTRYEIAITIAGVDYLVLYAARKTKQMLREALWGDAVLSRFEGCDYSTEDDGVAIWRGEERVALVRFTGHTQRDRRAGIELPRLEGRDE